MKKKIIIGLVLIVFIAIIAVWVSTYYVTKKGSEKDKQYKIETITDYKFFVVKEESKYGVIDTNGNKIIETNFDDVKIPNPEKAIFVCYENQDTRILNSNGEELFTEYEKVEPLRLKNVSSDLMYEKSVLKYKQSGKYGVMDFYGNKITDPIYQEIDTLQFKEGELLVKKDEKYGVININGAILVKENYDQIEADKFYEEGSGYKNSGYIVSEKTENGYRYGYVNIDGRQMTDLIYNDLYRITDLEGKDIYIVCAENGKYGVLKNDKKIVEHEYQSINYTQSNNTLTALKGKKYGILSTEGKVIVPFEYDQINVTGEYIYALINENTKIFNNEGQVINISKDLQIIDIKDTEYKIYIQTQEGKTIYSIYRNQSKLTKNDYTYIQYLYDNYFIACNTNGKLGVINEDEETEIQFNYNSIQTLESTKMIQALNNETLKTEMYSKEMKKIAELDNAILENNREYIKMYNDSEIKYISKDNEKEVKNIEIFTHNSIFANKLNDKWGFIDVNGNVVIDYVYDKVTEVNKYGFAGIKKNGLWGVINSEGEVIVQPKYKLNDSEPIFIGEYYQVIYGNGEIYYTKYITKK